MESTRTSEPEVTIDGGRLLGDLERLRQFGACGTGVVRQSLTPIDIESRQWLRERMEEAGLDARIDGVGTVFGRSRTSGRAILIGSHTDTQPTGGWLDGALGVIYGLEVARTLAENATTRDQAVDVASWIDEEGAFYGCLGSRSFCGETTDDAYQTTNAEGQTLREALRAAGLERVELVRLEARRYRGYVEAHIEQGPYLEDEGNRIGVVTGIVGSRNLLVTFEGEQNHAGTTPMARRRDAAHALVELAHAVYQSFPDHAAERTVWTIGRIDLEPNAVSIVPGRAVMNIQFRDQDQAVLDRLEALAHDLIDQVNRSSPVDLGVEPLEHPSIPAIMDAGLRGHIERAAARHAPDGWTLMPSAAVHDAQVLARHMPAAMMFVPSLAGISHAFEEDTDEADIVLGCQVLACAVASMLAE